MFGRKKKLGFAEGYKLGYAHASIEITAGGQMQMQSLVDILTQMNSEWEQHHSHSDQDYHNLIQEYQFDPTEVTDWNSPDAVRLAMDAGKAEWSKPNNTDL